MVEIVINNDAPRVNADKAVSNYLTVPKNERPPAQMMQASVSTVLDKNPDEAAELRRIHKETGVPMSALEDPQNKKDVVRRSNLDAFDFDAFAAAFPESARFLATPEMAAISHDDVDTIGAVETSIKQIGEHSKALGTGLVFSPAFYGAFEWGAGALSELVGQPLDYALKQLGADPKSDADPFDNAQRFFGKHAQDLDTVSTNILGELTEGKGIINRNTLSGAFSVGRTGPGLVAGAVTRNPAASLQYIGVTSFGEAAHQGLAEGLSISEAGGFAARHSGAEVLGESLPVIKFIDDLTAGTGVGKIILNSMVREVPSEILTTIFQNFNEWATLNPDTPFSVFLEELPSDIVDTVISTIFATGLQTGSISITTKALERAGSKQRRAQEGLAQAQTLEELIELAQNSKTLERDPDSFQTFVEELTDGEEVTDIFIDPDELAQSGVDLDALAEISPSVAKQRATAEGTGSLIKIPLAEFATVVAPTELAQEIVEIAKTDPQGMSKREAEEFMQNGLEELEQEVEKELTETLEETAKEIPRRNVEQNILDQLTETNRFTADVNQPYAALLGNFYETLGERTGQTAEEVFEAHPVKIQAQGVEGADVLNQSDQALPLKNDLGLFSKVEQEVSVANIQGWKANKKKALSDRERIALDNMNAVPEDKILPEVKKKRDALRAQAREADGLASGKEIWQKVSSLPVKKEELQWLGLEEFLKAGDKFTREEVVTFIQNNGVRVEEVIADQDNEGSIEDFNWTKEKTDDDEGVTSRAEDIKMEMVEGDSFYAASVSEVTDKLILDEESYIKANLELEGIEDMSPTELTEQYEVREYIREEFADTLDNRLYDKAEEHAQEEYDDNPFYEWTDENTGTVILGNDDVGYYINGVFNDIYSFAEAEIQAAAELREDGSFADTSDTSVAKWAEHQTPGPSDNYREVKLTLPEVEGDFYEEAHFPDRNVVAFLRVSDRELNTPGFLKHFGSELPADVPGDFISGNVADSSGVNRDVNFWQKQIEETEALQNNKNLKVVDTGPNGQGLQSSQSGKVSNMFIIVDKTKTTQHEGEEFGGHVDHILLDPDLSETEVMELYKEELKQKKQKAVAAIAKLATDYREEGVNRTNYLRRHVNTSAYFLDEFQSDWHQNGRQQGYQTGEVDAGEVDDQAQSIKFDIQQAHELSDQSFSVLVSKIKGEDVVQSTERTKALAEDPAIIEQVSEYIELAKTASAERYGVADAPFKGDAWMQLGLKRALVQAAEQGHRMFAWPDAEVLEERWSSRYAELYRVQYDTKMPSQIKKLTKTKPVHVKAEDNPEGFGFWAVEITPELREKILGEGFAFFQNQRGSFNPETSTISLLEAADLSTFLHESGHFFLETLGSIAGDTNAPEQIKEDMGTALKWMEIDDLAAWEGMTLEEQREAHEKFARGFEAYLFEGKAPSVGLQGVFQRFRSWLVSIYRDLRNLNVELSDEIRSVFDRLLATDNMIAEAETMRGMAPLFDSAEEAGMTQEEWENYQALGEEATAQAMDDLSSRTMRDMKWLANSKAKEIKRLQKDAREKRKAVRVQAEAEVMGEPVNQAYQFITRGEYIIPDNANKSQRRLGTELAVGEGSTKMSLQSLEDTYGTEDQIWQGLPTGKYGLVSKKGMDFNAIADLFAFSSGDQMLQMLLTREDPKVKIEALTDQRMLEKYGDISDPATLERAADEAVHNEARAKFVASEMAALQKATGGRKILASAAKQLAESMIARLRIRDVKPSRYTAAEAKAARAADKARRAGDLETAAVQKRNQMVQLYAAEAAMNALEQNQKDLRYLKKFDRDGSRKKIDVEYLDQIDAILERFDLRKSTTLRELDKKATLTEWLASQEEMGLEPDIPDAVINEAFRKHYKDMSVEEMRGVVDTIKQIEHLGRLKNKLLTLKDKRQFNAVVEDLVESIRENSKGPLKDNTTRATAGDRAKNIFRGYLASHRKVSSLSRQMDGVKDGGQMWEVFIRTMNEAGDREATLREEATIKMAEISAEVLALGRMGGKGTYFPALGRNLNREERLAIVLNMGNEGNIQRLLDGKGWTREAVDTVVETLTVEEAKFVQDVWDIFESYRPQIGAKERRIYGKEPEWIEPVPLSTPHGELRGGYYPIKYDTRQSAQANQHEEAELAKRQLKGAYTSSTTRRSFTKSRASEVRDRPLLITMDAMYSGLNEIVHDLSWHEWLIDANRLMRSKRMTQAILDTQGFQGLDQFKKAIEDIAAGEMPSGNSFEKVSAHLRAGATVAGLGLSVTTSLINVTGLAQSFVRVGPKWITMGINEWASNPTTLVGNIYEKSNFMRLRGKTMQREINEIQSLLRDKSKTRQAIDTISFMPLVYTQIAVDTPTWWGAYQKALTEDNGEERAIALADQAVVDAQGGGQVKDLAAIQRGGPMLKLWTTFYSYFSTTYNLTAEATAKTDFKDPMDIMRLGGDYFMLYVVPAFLGSVIRGAVSGDDDWAEPEELAKAYVNEQLDFVFGTMVGLRETTGFAQSIAGVKDFHGGYRGPAGLRFYNELDKLGTQIGQGELDKALRKSVVNVAGVTLRLPSSQTNRTIDGMVAIMDGKSQNPLSLVFGAPKN